MPWLLREKQDITVKARVIRVWETEKEVHCKSDKF